MQTRAATFFVRTRPRLPNHDGWHSLPRCPGTFLRAERETSSPYVGSEACLGGAPPALIVAGRRLVRVDAQEGRPSSAEEGPSPPKDRTPPLLVVLALILEPGELPAPPAPATRGAARAERAAARARAREAGAGPGRDVRIKLVWLTTRHVLRRISCVVSSRVHPGADACACEGEAERQRGLWRWCVQASGHG